MAAVQDQIPCLKMNMMTTFWFPFGIAGTPILERHEHDDNVQ